MNSTFKVEITEVNKELSAKERIQLKDLSNAVKLDTLTQTEGSIIIKPVIWAVLSVHNERAETDKDYKNYVLVDETGEKYSTGSNSFWNSFTNIVDEIGNDDVELLIKVYRMPSKNRVGKDFITCSLA